MKQPRRPVDPPAWTPRRVAAAVVLAAAALAVLAGGVWYWHQNRPLPEPTTAEEAMANLGTARFNNMPDTRRQEYIDKAWTLIRDLPRDERRALREKYADSERVEETMRARMHRGLVEAALAYNAATPAERAEMDAQPFGRPRNRPNDGDNANRDRGRDAEPTDADRDARRAHRRERMERWMEDGNPQTGPLIGERFQRMRDAREGG